MSEAQTPCILIIDDERNIRLTVGYALEGAGYRIESAVNGEEGLQKLREQAYDLVLLDLRMPGIGGIEVLRHIAGEYPALRVAVLTAHGTIDNAVEAMKLGAADFIQKPFTPAELRDLVADILARSPGEQPSELDYEGRVALAQRLASAHDLEAARAETRAAIARDPSRPQAFNTLGVLYELAGDRLQAQKNYRVAIDLDPTYEAARDNLDRTSDRRRRFDHPRFE